MRESGHSRRSLVAATAALAAAPGTTARIGKKGKIKKKKAPLAYAVMYRAEFTAADNGMFRCRLSVAYHHPASGITDTVDSGVSVPFFVARTSLAAAARELTAESLAEAGQDLPSDRIDLLVL